MTALDDERRAVAPDLAPLVASRICHDLSNPVGAINNGFELLEMTGAGGEEMDLVRSSVADAVARIDLLRLTFGAGDAKAPVGAHEVRRVLGACYGAGRLSVEWADADDHPRAEVRLALLVLNCLEASIPGRARITVRRDDGRWRVAAELKSVKDTDGAWDALQRGSEPDDLTSRTVQFGLLARHAAAAGRIVEASVEPPEAVVTV